MFCSNPMLLIVVFTLMLCPTVLLIPMLFKLFCGLKPTEVVHLPVFSPRLDALMIFVGFRAMLLRFGLMFVVVVKGLF